MEAAFTVAEKTVLKGHKAAIAKKHGCSITYVVMIIEGDREINTPLAKKIYKDLKNLAKILTPESDQE